MTEFSRKHTTELASEAGGLLKDLSQKQLAYVMGFVAGAKAAEDTSNIRKEATQDEQSGQSSDNKSTSI